MPARTFSARLRPALVGVLGLSTLTGILYPLAVTGLAKALFPRQAGGSLLRSGNQVLGSALIGQAISDPGLFWTRPSATLGTDGRPAPYNALASGGSNLGPTNPELARAAQIRIALLKAADPGNQAPVPVDLVTASGSGLDPHITPEAALYQAGRVARARGLPEAGIRALVAAHTEGPQLGFLGAPRVNVMKLNLALAELR